MEFYYHSVDKDVLILSADGGLNADNADWFLGELEKLVQAGIRKLIVDCKKLRFISSYGVGVLVRLHNKLAPHGGNVKLAAVDSSVVRLLEVLSLNRLFHVYANVDDAREAFHSEATGS
jgi:anti-sigma B factor antagonist